MFQIFEKKKFLIVILISVWKNVKHDSPFPPLLTALRAPARLLFPNLISQHVLEVKGITNVYLLRASMTCLDVIEEKIDPIRTSPD